MKAFPLLPPQFLQRSQKHEMKMKTVSAADFQCNIGRYQDWALCEPIAVTRNGRDSTIIISAEEYRRLKKRERQVLGLEDFTPDDIAALEASRAIAGPRTTRGSPTQIRMQATQDCGAADGTACVEEVGLVMMIEERMPQAPTTRMRKIVGRRAAKTLIALPECLVAHDATLASFFS